MAGGGQTRPRRNSEPKGGLKQTLKKLQIRTLPSGKKLSHENHRLRPMEFWLRLPATTASSGQTVTSTLAI